MLKSEYLNIDIIYSPCDLIKQNYKQEVTIQCNKNITLTAGGFERLCIS